MGALDKFQKLLLEVTKLIK